MKNIFFWLSRKINYPFVCPEVMQISVTYRCNLRCRMCSIAGLLPQEEELSTKRIFGIIDEAKAYGIKQVLVTGGEPFLRGDIFDICSYIHNCGLSCVVTTNGIGVNKEMACDIAKAGIDHLHFSLDGLQETHDFFRGAGSFDKLMSSISELDSQRRNGRFFSLGIAVTLMDKNAKELLKIVKLADDLRLDVVNFQPVMKNNANFPDKNESEFGIRQENLEILLRELGRVRLHKPKHLKIYAEPSLELLAKYYRGTLGRKDWVCFGGLKTLFVCYSKKQPLVYSCHGICGNLDNVSLRKAWLSREAFALRRSAKNCGEPCLQSCYSLEAAQNFARAIKSFGKQGV